MSKRYLAIDLGAKRTGLAIGDQASGIVTPLTVVLATGTPMLLEQLARIIAQQEPDELVVGLPLNMDGSVGPPAKAVAQFANELRQQFSLEVHLFDERLSSYEADQRMGQTGLTHRGKKARRDAQAAAVILSDFLSRLAQEGDDNGPDA
jgi:putative Holliday junction resolvase